MFYGMLLYSYAKSYRRVHLAAPQRRGEYEGYGAEKVNSQETA